MLKIFPICHFFWLMLALFSSVYHEMSPVLRIDLGLNYFTVQTGLVTFIC